MHDVKEQLGHSSIKITEKYYIYVFPEDKSKTLDYTKQKIAEINKKIYDNLKPNNYLHTNIETPIFTITSNKYENLSNELRKKGLVTENCDTFINLDSSYARVRIGKDWKKMLVILQETL